MTKTKRFEIFKRDGFTCQYCGNRPPDVVLEVDHIDPKSKGGGDNDINLITSCFDCNRGKKEKLLGDRTVRPDADLEFLRIQQEIAEAQRYIQAKEKLDEARRLLISSLQDTWEEYVSSDDLVPTDIIIARWLVNFTPEEIERAIRIGGMSYASGKTHGGFEGVVRYVAGILWRTKRGDMPL